MIDIEPRHLEIIRSILKKHLPKNTSVWLFGSRATGKAKRYSDLDLAIDCNQLPIPLYTKAHLTQDLEDSSLPYTVDIVDITTIEPSFKNIIDQTKIALDI